MSLLSSAEARQLLPYLLLEARMTGERGRYWLLVQSVRSLEEGLRLALSMKPLTEFRLYCGRDYGYRQLQHDQDGMPYWE